jgi:RimJ/RimL family protein N-acetyltransferase
VVLHGRPDEDGVAVVGYGVERGSQGRGYATEGTRAAVAWAFSQPGVCVVRATTYPFHAASLRVIAKLGMKRVDTREDALFGELYVFAITREEFVLLR